MTNAERNIVKIIKEICSEEGIECRAFSYDWILKLSKDNKSGLIYGYQFDINSAAASAVCTDKSAACEVLADSGVPAVRHELFMAPGNTKYVGFVESWGRLSEMLDDYGALVCKANEGTGGRNVYHVRNQFELEEASHKIFKASRTMAVSPFIKIDNEYRIIILNGEAKLIYVKNIPYITGDGKRGLKELIVEHMYENMRLPDIDISSYNANAPLAEGEIFYLNWKHNLGNGAAPEIITDAQLRGKLGVLAESAAKATGITFASVDIIESVGEYRVLEINSGIMTEHLSRYGEENYRLVKEIYREAVNLMMK